MSNTGDLLEAYLTYLITPAYAPTWAYWLFLSAHLILMLILFVAMYQFLRESRLMHDTPTSKIRSSAQGFVELKGYATSLNPMLSPLTKMPCAWWEYKIEKSKGSGKSQKWITIEKGTSEHAFVLYDETGECIIHPEGAEIIPHQDEIWHGDSADPLEKQAPNKSMFYQPAYQFTERLLLPEFPLYALGMFRTLNPTDNLPEVGDIIREWKSNFQRLVEKYDRNKDGELDENEWQQVIQDAEAELQKQTASAHEELKGDPFHILSIEGMPKRRSFIISGMDEEILCQERKKSSRYCTIFFFIVFAHNLYAIASKLF